MLKRLEDSHTWLVLSPVIFPPAISDKALRLKDSSWMYRKEARYLNLRSSLAAKAAIAVVVFLFLIFLRYWLFWYTRAGNRVTFFFVLFCSPLIWCTWTILVRGLVSFPDHVWWVIGMGLMHKQHTWHYNTYIYHLPSNRYCTYVCMYVCMACFQSCIFGYGCSSLQLPHFGFCCLSENLLSRL